MGSEMEKKLPCLMLIVQLKPVTITTNNYHACST